MFNDTFYPTPPSVIAKMIEGLRLTDKSILEPHAGTGNILEYVHENKFRHYKKEQLNFYAIEINPDLRAILLDKQFKIVGTNFLAYPGLQYFDVILMNPPFNEGGKHLLKAWDIANGATIRCLLNSETLNNPYTLERKRIVDLIEKYGWSKDLGPVFKDAERKTSVNVSLVHLEDTRTKEPYRLDFNPVSASTDDFDLEDVLDNELALGGIFDSYEAQFNAALKSFKDMLKARQKVEHYLESLIRKEAHPTPKRLIGDALSGDKGPDVSYDLFFEAVTKGSWDTLFSKTKLREVTTEGVRKEIEILKSSQGAMAFTGENMEELFNTLFLNRENVMLQCILEVFDYLTRHHKENRLYLEGWKTNTAYMVKSKFILPYVGNEWSNTGLNYKTARELNDIEKALCFISGKKLESIVTVESQYDRESHYGEWRESTFFRTKLFKKKTMHFIWKDEDLRKEFNAVVARERWGELPEKVKKGVYR